MKTAWIGVGALGIVAAAGAAWAGQGGHHRMMTHMIAARVEQAEDFVEATPQQRQVIDAAKDDVVAQITAHMAQRTSHRDEIVAALTADNLDTAKLYALVDQHTDEMKAMARLVMPDLQKVHDVLTPAQRQKLAQKIKQHHGDHGF
jgi:Spy/CpxP family protein refolding chaperone